jgi:hypothetical protein
MDHRHNLRLLAAAALYMPIACYGAVLSHRNSVLGITLVIISTSAAVFFIFAGLKRLDNRFCHKIGFLCPFCNPPLYAASDAATDLVDWNPLITRDECPNCRKQLVSKISTNSLDSN